MLGTFLNFNLYNVGLNQTQHRASSFSYRHSYHHIKVSFSVSIPHTVGHPQEYSPVSIFLVTKFLTKQMLLFVAWQCSYERSLSVLKHAKLSKDGMITKSSIMLGLGETDDELKEAMADLRAIDVDILTLGQYLQVNENDCCKLASRKSYNIDSKYSTEP